MAVFLGVHTGATRSEYKEMQEKLNTALPNDKIVTIPNVHVVYNAVTKRFSVENTAIREDSFVSVYYVNAEAASECGLQADTSGSSVVFKFDSEPSEDIICTIVITQKGGV